MMIQSSLEKHEVKSSKDVLLGELLVSKGLLTHRTLIEALNEQRNAGGRLGETLLRLKMLTDRDLTSALAEHLSTEYVSLDDLTKIDMNIARSIPENLAKKFCLIAIGELNNKLIIAMADPLNVIAIDTVTLKTQRQVKIVLSSPAEIEKAADAIYHGSDVDQQKIRDIVDTEIETEDATPNPRAENAAEADICDKETKAPVIRFVNLLLSQAVKSRASDIHIEPQDHAMSIRMRIDGILVNMVPPARKMQAAVSTRIKILSKMDIAERRLPQDGRFKIKAADRDIDVRVSVIPTIYGEKVVMRILDAASVDHNIEKLGFEPSILDEFKRILALPHGIIVVTGPTGSGKSTTLYSALNYLNNPIKNITTVEDPVEYRLRGINQIQVKPEINLDFASCLRSIMRQDPDIILIGEIRDKETVEIAIKASLTGHLVLSTFHTNDAPSAISRFIYMGVQPYLLASTLNLIIAQRLVRRICDRCKQPVTISDDVLRTLNIDHQLAKETIFYQGKGCQTCGGTGYFGRLPIFEFMPIDNQMRQKLIDGASESEMRKILRSRGYGGLLESGVNNILKGRTTPQEVLNVTFAESNKA